MKQFFIVFLGIYYRSGEINQIFLLIIKDF